MKFLIFFTAMPKAPPPEVVAFLTSLGLFPRAQTAAWLDKRDHMLSLLRRTVRLLEAEKVAGRPKLPPLPFENQQIRLAPEQKEYIKQRVLQVLGASKDPQGLILSVLAKAVEAQLPFPCGKSHVAACVKEMTRDGVLVQVGKFKGSRYLPAQA